MSSQSQAEHSELNATTPWLGTNDESPFRAATVRERDVRISDLDNPLLYYPLSRFSV